MGIVCNNFASAIRFDKGRMVFKLFRLFDVVTRKMDGEEMIFTFVDGIQTRTKRICQYPPDNK